MITAAAPGTGGSTGGGTSDGDGGGTDGLPPPPPSSAASPSVRVSFKVEGTVGDVGPAAQGTLAAAIADVALVPPTSVRVSVATVSYGTDTYSTGSQYSALASNLVINADVSAASGAEVATIRNRLSDALPDAAAASALLARGSVPLGALERPAISSTTDPIGGGNDLGGANSQGDSSGSSYSSALFLAFVVVVIVGGGYWHLNKRGKGAQTPAGAAAPTYEVGSVSAQAAEAPAPPSSEGAPEGWDEHTDPKTGHKYYVNKQSGETTWTMPDLKV